VRLSWCFSGGETERSPPYSHDLTPHHVLHGVLNAVSCRVSKQVLKLLLLQHTMGWTISRLMLLLVIHTHKRYRLRFELGSSLLHSSTTCNLTMHVHIIGTVFWLVGVGKQQAFCLENHCFFWSLYKGFVQGLCTRALYKGFVQGLCTRALFPSVINKTRSQ
jgi:hypothetical protein